MLQECRARLANTKGKKAKRKAREKQLEEAQRLAQLQKKRELKMAGIEIHRHLKIKGCNYNKEIPFQRNVPAGKYSATDKETPQINSFQANITLQQIEQKRRDEEEKKKRALDSKRMRKLKEKNLPKALETINAVNTQSEAEIMRQIKYNYKLDLAQPKISNQELQDIQKLVSFEDSKSVVSRKDEISTIIQQRSML